MTPNNMAPTAANAATWPPIDKIMKYKTTGDRTGNKDDMEKIKITKDFTKNEYQKNSFVYAFWSSMRQKVNDPLGRRATKREEISRR